MKTRISQKILEINSQKKNNAGEACFLPFEGEVLKYSEAKPSVAVRGEAPKKRGAIFPLGGKSPSVVASSDNSWPGKINLSEASKKDFADIVLSHYEKNSLSGPRLFNKRESIQRKILQSDFEKTKKENRIKELRKIKPPTAPLKPYYQIQTCDLNNAHFARVMVLCSCNDHINCGVCRLKRMARLQKKYLPALEEFKNAKMLTLTMKRQGDLKSDLLRLNKCLMRFKKTKAFKKNVFAYFGTKEVVENNVHAHIMIDGLFWDQKEISNLWREITGTDFIVDVRRIKNPAKAIKEVFKYIVKDFKTELVKQVSDFRKENSHFRWVFSSKGLSSFDEGEGISEAIPEAEILSALEGEAEGALSSLDTKAISGRRGCPCCGSNLILVGNFESKEEAEAESRRILAGNQYRNPKRT